MKNVMYSMIIAALCTLNACEMKATSDTIQQEQQERILAEGTSQVGMPSIVNFRERKIVKDVLELRDQEGLITYTYLFSEVKGCLVFLGNTVGYPIPYATQFTNPQKVVYDNHKGYATMPQADPNGLFSPGSAEGSWILMQDPHRKEAKVIYTEPRVITLPFKAEESTLCNGRAASTIKEDSPPPTVKP